MNGGDGSSSARHPKVGLHGSSDLVDPELGAAPVADVDLERLLRAYRVVAPALAGRVVAAATCLYTMSPDGHFLVGPAVARSVSTSRQDSPATASSSRQPSGRARGPGDRRPHGPADWLPVAGEIRRSWL